MKHFVYPFVSGSMYVLEDLKPQTPYEFRFAARNEVGLGNWGGYHNEITPVRNSPNEPKIITAGAEYDLSTYNNQYQLRWTKPADNGEPIDMYQIKYCRVKRISGGWEVLEDTCETQVIRSTLTYWLKNLQSDTFYTVELKAHNAIGFSQPGSAKFKTARGKFLSFFASHRILLQRETHCYLLFFLLFHTFVVVEIPHDDV